MSHPMGVTGSRQTEMGWVLLIAVAIMKSGYDSSYDMGLD